MIDQNAMHKREKTIAHLWILVYQNHSRLYIVTEVFGQSLENVFVIWSWPYIRNDNFVSVFDVF